MTAIEARKLRVDPVEADPVAAIVTAARADRYLASRKLLGNDPSDLANAVVVGIPSDVEDLAAHGILGRYEGTVNGLADVLDVDDRSPWAAVTQHRYAPRGPGERAKIVDDDVEPHPRRRAVCGRIAQEHGQKSGPAMRPTSLSTSTLHSA